jgi:Protein of unknown function (DUF2934)
MWFVQQFDSFINLGICKEYPNMARPKSTSGSKANRTNTTTTNEQTSTGSAANIPDVKAATAGTTPAEVAADLKPAPELRKLEVVKTESRKSVVVPIKLEDEIRRRAYELYVQRGSTPGSEAEDWLAAEREVRQRYQKQQSA